MYNHSLKLIERQYEVVNHQDVPKDIETEVLCKIRSVGRTEFYQAQQAKLNPEIVFIVKAYEYSGQDTVKYQSERYKVIRTYQSDFEEVELVCERLNRS